MGVIHVHGLAQLKLIIFLIAAGPFVVNAPKPAGQTSISHSNLNIREFCIMRPATFFLFFSWPFPVPADVVCIFAIRKLIFLVFKRDFSYRSMFS